MEKLEKQPVTISATCPVCGEELKVSAMVNPTIKPITDPTEAAPKLRGNLKPVGAIMIYKITSEDIINHITNKIRANCSNAKVEGVTLYCEKKQKGGKKDNIKDETDRFGYASMRICVSDDVINDNGADSFYVRFGEGPANVNILENVYLAAIKPFMYKRSDLNEWLDSYKKLDYLYEKYGMDQAFIEDIMEYITPKRRTSIDGKDWVMFSVAPELVIADMMVDLKTKEKTEYRIMAVYPIDKDNVEFKVYLLPATMPTKENPHVRQIMMADKKNK